MGNSPKDSGFSISDSSDLTIASGETDSDIIDLGRGYAFVCVGCDDMDGIDASTTLTIKVSYRETGTMRDLYAVNLGALFTSPVLPATGTFQTTLINAIGVRRIQFILSKVTTAEVVFDIVGADSGIV